MRALLLACVLAVGCSFNPSGQLGPDGGDVDASTSDPDAGEAVVEDIHHVPAAEERLGVVDVTIANDLVLDTTDLAVTSGEPAGITLVAVPQDGGGPELAVLRVRDLVIVPGVVLRASGSRPLVILARSVRIDGVIDVSGRGAQRGAGGSPANNGGGPGAAGQRNGAFYDSGGGGGGFGTSGGPGGNQIGSGDGNGGIVYGGALLSTLDGGSGGGGASGGGCAEPDGGGGGGALQIYAAVAIVLPGSGGINAGGGGGGGGQACPAQYTAGRGGGSGGAIYLQSPAIDRAGALTANGGGGGGGAGGLAANGTNGGDGKLTGERAAGGLRGAGLYGSDGGYGATAEPAGAGGSNVDAWANGGGGGGGVGRIVIRTRQARGEGLTSPVALTMPY